MAQETRREAESRRQRRVRAVTYTPGEEALRVADARAPERGAGDALARTLLAGVDGTDEEVVEDPDVVLPEGRDAIVLGHECLGEVVEAPEGSGLEPGDLVVPLVRHGCGRCPPCVGGASDYCRTGDFTEHGIKGLDGFMRDEWVDEAATLVPAPRGLGALAVLTEPLSIVLKALEASRAIQRRLPFFEEEGGFAGRRALLAGTGSLGSLGAFLLRDAGMDVWGMDRQQHDAFGSRLLGEIGVRHVNAKEEEIRDVAREVGGFDLVIEATGVPEVLFDVMGTLNENGVLCTLGVPPEKPPFQVAGDDLMRTLVMGNRAVFGSVNSNRAHFEASMRALLRFRERWGDRIERVITHGFSPDDAAAAFEAEDADLVKKVIVWDEEWAPRFARRA